MFPPLPPNAGGWHPLLVHFPVALLVVAPLFVALGILFVSRRQWAASALILMALGSAGALASAFTGEKAGEWAGNNGLIPAEATQVLQEHQKMGGQCRVIFPALALVYAALLVAPALWKRVRSPRAQRGAHLVFLLVYLIFLMWVPKTAHLGGRLVHEFGVQAPVAAQTAGGGTASAETPRRGE